mmetsp:Transcript_1144/g.1555  ORF Transcript_1144/g.1555 Transcript_1144/m.1555 type:complete len:708 (-) Transcript_1144:146-2269(-)
MHSSSSSTSTSSLELEATKSSYTSSIMSTYKSLMSINNSIQSSSSNTDYSNGDNKDNNNDKDNMVYFEQWNNFKSSSTDTNNDNDTNMNSRKMSSLSTKRKEGRNHNKFNYYVNEKQDYDDDDEVVDMQLLDSNVNQLFYIIAKRFVHSTTTTTQQQQQQSEHETLLLFDIQELSWKDLSTIVWSYANRDGGYYVSKKISDIITTMMKEFTTEAIQRLQQQPLPPPGVAAVTASAANTKLLTNNNDEHSNNDFLPRDVAQLAWSLGILQLDNFLLSDILEEYVNALTSHYAMKTKMNMSMNMTYMNDNDDRQTLRMDGWTSKDYVQVAVACARGRLNSIPLLDHIYKEVLSSLKEEMKNVDIRHNNNNNQNYQTRKTSTTTTKTKFQSWELSVLLWVQARLHLTKELSYTFDEYADIVPSVLLSRMKLPLLDDDNEISSSSSSTRLELLQHGFEKIKLGAQEQANICWSLTVLEKYHSPEAIRLLQGIFNTSTATCFNEVPIRLEHAHQLWQSLFLLDSNEHIELNVDKEFYSFLKDSWDHEKSRHKTSSARHTALSETLDFMGVKHYNEHDEDIDVAIVLQTGSKWLHMTSKDDDGGCGESERKVAVEFDGPAHFTKQRQLEQHGPKQDTPRALGHTVLKYKLLKAQGWTVVRIPFYEFDRIPFWASMERQRYLQRKLKTHANIQFSGIDVSVYKAPIPNKQSRFD